MKRVILKQHDDINGVWLVHYCRVYGDSVNVQTFRTYHQGWDRKPVYVGHKRRQGPDQWIGKAFLSVLCSAAGVRPGVGGYVVKGATGIQMAMAS